VKKNIVMILVFSLCVTAFTQEKRILEHARKTFIEGKYNQVITSLNISLKSEEIKDKNILSEAYLFLGLSYFKTAKEYLAMPQIENAFKTNPDLEINRNDFDSKTVEFFDTMKKEMVGSLRIITRPDSADVFIENDFIGKTPLFIKAVFADAYNFTILKNRYEMITESYFVEPDQENTLEKILKWNDLYGVLIDSEPKGVDVTMDDAFQGQTPLFIYDMMADTYELELSGLKGYKDYKRSIKIPGEKGTKIFIKLKGKRDYFLYSLFVPGLGQLRMKQYKHSVLSFGICAGWYAFYRYFINSKPRWIYARKYYVLRKNEELQKYEVIIDEEIVDYVNNHQEARDRKMQEEDEKSRYEQLKYFNQIWGLGVYFFNLVDTWYLIKKDEKKFDSGISFISRPHYAGIKITHYF